MKKCSWPLLFCAIFFLSLLSCSDFGKKEDLRPIAEEFFETYKARKDFNKFLSFYDEQIVLEDIINGDRIKGKKNVKAFLDWDNNKFQLIDSVVLELEYLIVEERKVVAKGHFTPFQWGDSKFGPMHFTTILNFNVNKKIVKQVDWINYPYKLIDPENRKSANDWISN